MALIDCQAASFAYEGNQVLNHINFTVEAGDYLCIVGENGSGKSTLMKGLLGLKKPEAGQIVFSPDLKRNEIGYLPQQTPVQRDFPASVHEVVLSGCLARRGLKPFYTKQDKKEVFHNLELLGIIGLKNRCYRELSGGQQQRVLLARALCSARKLLILDEPATGLDPIVTKGLYQAIQKINSETGMSIIMVSHDVQNAVEYSSHILHLNHDQLFFGETKDYQKKEISRNFLGGEA